MTNIPDDLDGSTSNIEVGSISDLTDSEVVIAGRDAFRVGDVNSTVAVIGSGAQVVYQNIERALTSVEIKEQAETHDQKLLAQAITTYTRRLQEQAQSGISDKPERRNPYKPLISYDIQDAATFFGRDSDIESLLAHIQRDRLTVVHAESGSGKTSLVKAGIVPRLLATGHLPLYIRPMSTPVGEAIKRTLLPQVENTHALLSASLHEFLHKVVVLLQGQWLFIILDQFEEIFSLQMDDMRTTFAEQLARCLDDNSLKVRWILALRGEWLSRMSTFRPYLRNPLANECYLPAFTRLQAQQVIEMPVRMQGISYDSALIEQILDDLGSKLFHPPQLQLVCSTLYDERKDEKIISTLDYRGAGGARTILGEHLDRVIARQIPSEQRVLARRTLSAFVSTEKHAVIRFSDELSNELINQGNDVSNLNDLLQQMVNSHLLRSIDVVQGERSGQAYELAHEYLVEKIELDPESINRKYAQELLDQKSKYHKQFGITLSFNELALISPYLPTLTVSQGANRLLKDSRRQVMGVSILKNLSGIFIVIAGLYALLALVSILFVNLFPWDYQMGILFGLILLFSINGIRRGVVKEGFVTLHLLLGFVIITFVKYFIPASRYFFLSNSLNEYGFSISVLGLLAMIGYFSPYVDRLDRKWEPRNRLLDSLFGLMLGGLNAFLIFGSLWFYEIYSNYPYLSLFWEYVHPLPSFPRAGLALAVIDRLPLFWLHEFPDFYLWIIGLTGLVWVLIFSSRRVFRVKDKD